VTTLVEKMKYISITGHIASMNHVVSRYLSRFDIQLEAGPHLPGQMEAFGAPNPYANTMQKAENFLAMLGPAPSWHVPMTGATAVNLVETAHTAYEQRSVKLRQMEDEHKTIGAYIHRLQPFADFDVPLDLIESMNFIHCRFGRMAVEHFRQYEAFLCDDEKILLQDCKRDKDYVWVVYFTPMEHKDVVDVVFSSLQFEAIPLIRPLNTGAASSDPNTLNEEIRNSDFSYPAQLLKYYRGYQTALEIKIQTLTKQSIAETIGSKDRLCIACEKVQALHASFDVKKHAALSKGRRIFTFVGWMAEKDALQLEEEIDGDELAVFARYGETAEAPPIRLKNLPIVRNFEFFTRLYGLPVYGEVDPTPLLAVTYTLLFGLMFGDVGHGLVLALLGLYIYIALKKPLGSILAVVGVSAMVFGFFYGSIFGFEDILPALWRRPMNDITATLWFAVGIGVGLIVLSMCLHMYNAAKQGRVGDLLFGANGVAGLLFYSTVLWLAFRALFWGQPLTGPVIALGALPLVLVVLKHPIISYMERRSGQSSSNMGGGSRKSNTEYAAQSTGPNASQDTSPHSGSPQPAGIGMFVFNIIIQLFETLLTYATNTISFVRVGAFAISHAGMMHVVLQLSGGAAGSRNLLVLVLGNILVMAIEGLLVGIQVLRLDFYEIFSRFYTGGGRGFVSNRLARK